MNLSFALSILALPLCGAPFAAAQTSPAVSAPIPLSGDATIVAAAGDQSDVSLAPGGAGFLAVWSDRRGQLSSVGGPESGLDVWGLRLDAAGAPLDLVPFPIARAPGDDRAPRATWNGSAWLVTWTAQSHFDSPYSEALLGTRVSTAGTVLDATPLVLAGDGTQVIPEYAVASDGSVWTVVAWGGTPPSDGLRAVRVSGTGAVLDANPVVLVPGAGFMTAFDLAFAQGVYLLAWTSSSGSTGSDVVGRRFDSQLQPLGAAAFPLGVSFLDERTPSVATNGASFLVAWSRYSAGTIQGDIRAARVASDGTVVDPTPLVVTGDKALGVGRVSCAFGGTQWYVAWAWNGLELARIATSGAVIDPDGVRVHAGTPPATARPALARSALGGVEIAIHDPRGGSYEGLDVYGCHVVDPATPGPEVVLSRARPAQTAPAVATDGTGSAIAFASETSGTRRILLSRTDASGHSVDAEPIEITNDPFAWAPAVAFDGASYLVVWSQGPSPHAATGVYGRRVSAGGLVLDPQPIAIGVGSWPRVAARPGEFLVAWARPGTGFPIQQFPSVVRVRGSDGAVLGPPATLASTFCAGVDVVRLATRWMIVWQRNYSVSDTHGDVQLAFVDDVGLPSAPTFVAGDFNTYQHSVRVASAGSEALVTWVSGTASNQTRRVRVRRVREDGAFLDAASVALLPTLAREQFAPAVAWDGSAYLVLFQDHRNTASFLDRRSDVFGARVLLDGTRLDPTGFLVEASVESEVSPAIAGRGGQRALAAIARTEPSAAAYRVRVRTFDGVATPPATYCTGKTTSLGLVPSIGHQGGGSIAASDLVVTLIQGVPNAPAILFHGSEPFAQPFLGGTLCVRPPLVRGVVRTTSPAGTLSEVVDVDPTLLGVTRCYQWFTRDAAQIDGTGASLSNALSVTFAP